MALASALGRQEDARRELVPPELLVGFPLIASEQLDSGIGGRHDP